MSSCYENRKHALNSNAKVDINMEIKILEN